MAESKQWNQLDLVAQATKTLVLYSLAEFQAGHASQITVEARGWSFSVSDNGRGHSASRLVEKSPYLKFVYSHLEYPFQEGAGEPVQLQGLGMSLLNVLCHDLQVTARRREGGVTVRFIDGLHSGQESLPAGSEDSGNKASATLHKALQTQPTDENAIALWLSVVARSHPGLLLSFNGRLIGQSPQSDA
jgi:DNA gyrase/topoisomerase IV subunit B